MDAIHNKIQYTLQREAAALLVIDEQDRLLKAIRQEDTLRKNTSVLLEAAKAYHLPAFYSEQYPKGLGSTNPAILKGLEELSAFRIEKTAYNAASAEMLAALQASGRRQIVVMGAESHICVFQTVRSLLGQGFSVFVPADAVSSRTVDNWQIGLSLMREMGAVISSTEALLFDLIQDARDPYFKPLQALIK